MKDWVIYLRQRKLVVRREVRCLDDLDGSYVTIDRESHNNKITFVFNGEYVRFTRFRPDPSDYERAKISIETLEFSFAEPFNPTDEELFLAEAVMPKVFISAWVKLTNKFKTGLPYKTNSLGKDEILVFCNS